MDAEELHEATRQAYAAARAEKYAAWREEAVQRRRAETAEACLSAVREAAHVADEHDVTDWQRGYRACAERVLAVLSRDPDKPGRDRARGFADDVQQLYGWAFAGEEHQHRDRLHLVYGCMHEWLAAEREGRAYVPLSNRDGR
ncbi:hypothetical protein [Kitasatospora fiedleri]|uniref:hypothetical protein n=1 Tax=Kitasatospora fiedleri TaxID=2991545 RepID=UPI00249B44A9|nr:hypothetical protein [Kitasatospora fiedleri]